SVFHTAPPQPASNARITWSAVLVGGPEASQNGFGLTMPAVFVVQSMGLLLPLVFQLLMSIPPGLARDRARSGGDGGVHGVGGLLGALDHLHDGGRVATSHAIAGGVDAWVARAPGRRVGRDATILSLNAEGAQCFERRHLSGGLDHHVALDHVCAAGL